MSKSKMILEEIANLKEKMVKIENILETLVEMINKLETKKPKKAEKTLNTELADFFATNSVIHNICAKYTKYLVLI